jgi:selenocysteine lyase/cysteine desulfurase
VLGEAGPDPTRRVPTVSFVARGWGSRALVERVEAETGGGAVFAFRWGAFYSNRLVYELLGLDEDGVIRVSMVHYNTGMYIFVCLSPFRVIFLSVCGRSCD